MIFQFTLFIYIQYQAIYFINIEHNNHLSFIIKSLSPFNEIDDKLIYFYAPKQVYRSLIVLEKLLKCLEPELL